MSQHPSMLAFMALVVIFAVFMLVVLFTAVRTTHADVIRPDVSLHQISIGSSGVKYDAGTGILTVADNTAAFTYRQSGTSQPQFIYNLGGSFGGAYMLRALYTGTGANAPLDGLFTTVGLAQSDLVITGEIPAMGITRGNGYTGTLLEANVIVGEFFGYSASNSTAEYNLLLEVVRGDLVTAGEYAAGSTAGELSSIFSISPALPSGFAFGSGFTATYQSGTIGTPIPEPATIGLIGLGCMALLTGRRMRKR